MSHVITYICSVYCWSLLNSFVPLFRNGFLNIFLEVLAFLKYFFNRYNPNRRSDYMTLTETFCRVLNSCSLPLHTSICIYEQLFYYFAPRLFFLNRQCAVETLRIIIKHIIYVSLCLSMHMTLLCLNVVPISSSCNLFLSGQAPRVHGSNLDLSLWLRQQGMAQPGEVCLASQQHWYVWLCTSPFLVLPAWEQSWYVWLCTSPFPATAWEQS